MKFSPRFYQLNKTIIGQVKKVSRFAPLKAIISFHLLVINKESLHKSTQEKTHQKLEMSLNERQN